METRAAQCPGPHLIGSLDSRRGSGRSDPGHVSGSTSVGGVTDVGAEVADDDLIS